MMFGLCWFGCSVDVEVLVVGLDLDLFVLVGEHDLVFWCELGVD